MSFLNLLLLAFALGDDGATLQGSVRAESSREPIANASVVVEGLKRAVMTDQHGLFVLDGIPQGRWRVKASALGYRTHDLTIISSGRGAVRLDFELERQPVELKPLEATTTARGSKDNTITEMAAGPPALHVTGESLKRVPALIEADVLRALQTLPSINAISDWSSALYVRGGSPDQTMISLDGAPLFNPYHLGGIFAAIDPDAVASVDAYSGALPARAGDRVSGGVHIHTREGGKDRMRAQGGIGLISSRASVDGPLFGGKGSYLVSARHTYVDLITRAAYRVGLMNSTMPYGFSDAHLKFTRSVGPLGFISATVYVDHEGISIPERMKKETDADVGFGWGSRAATLSFRQPLGNNLLADFRLGFSDFTGSFDASDLHTCSDGCFDFQTREPELLLDATTAQRDILANADFTWYRGTHEVRTGAALDAYLFEHHVNVPENDLRRYVPSFVLNDRPRTLAAYLEDEWTISDALQVRGGVRMLSAGDRGNAALPRVGARLVLNPKFSVSAGAGRYAQVMSSLRNDESIGASLIAYDLLAAHNPAGLVRGEDLVVGAEWRPSNISIRVDAYTKRTRNVPLPSFFSDAIDAPVFVVDSVSLGRGYSRGLEVLARYQRGRTDIGLSYSLSSAELEVDGARFPARYDRRHLVDVTATYGIGTRGEISTRIALGTGQPYTRVVGAAEPLTYDPGARGFWPGFNQRTVLLGDHNSDRLPGYFRVDVAMRREFAKRWFGRDIKITPYVQVVNATNSKNTLIGDPSALGQLRLKHYPQLPLLPTIGFEWHF